MRDALEFAAFETACHVGDRQDVASVQEMLEESPHTTVVPPMPTTDVIDELSACPGQAAGPGSIDDGSRGAFWRLLGASIPELRIREEIQRHGRLMVGDWPRDRRGRLDDRAPAVDQEAECDQISRTAGDTVRAGRRSAGQRPGRVISEDERLRARDVANGRRRDWS